MENFGRIVADAHASVVRRSKEAVTVSFQLNSVPVRKNSMCHKTLPPWEFEHAPLPKPTCIRLLDLQPGDLKDVVQCRLRVVDLDDDPEYSCLSYTWKREHLLNPSAIPFRLLSPKRATDLIAGWLPEKWTKISQSGLESE
jgi:hypothetical protein